MVIQIVVTMAVIFVVLPNIYASYKKNNLTSLGAILWTIFWIIGLFIIWFPDIIGVIGDFLGVTRSIDALVYISVVLLLFLAFKQKIKINEIEKEITQLGRKITLKDLNNERKK